MRGCWKLKGSSLVAVQFPEDNQHAYILKNDISERSPCNGIRRSC